jgi:hypothetical protein
VSPLQAPWSEDSTASNVMHLTDANFDGDCYLLVVLHFDLLGRLVICSPALQMLLVHDRTSVLFFCSAQRRSPRSGPRSLCFMRRGAGTGEALCIMLLLEVCPHWLVVCDAVCLMSCPGILLEVSAVEVFRPVFCTSFGCLLTTVHVCCFACVLQTSDGFCYRVHFSTCFAHPSICRVCLSRCSKTMKPHMADAASELKRQKVRSSAYFSHLGVPCCPLSRACNSCLCDWQFLACSVRVSRD